MNRIIYDIFIFIYSKIILLASGVNEKARLWVKGRQHLPLTGTKQPSIWIHCSSLGEFEQGRPVLEALRSRYPDYRIILSFFSPSGYEIRKNYSGADLVCYLPVDTAANAQKVLDDWNPQLVIWVKYEYWYHFLHAIHQRKIPLLLISAHFRINQPFFKPWGGFWKRMLGFFSHVFVQTNASWQLLQNSLPPSQVTVSGDTRFDRVVALSENRQEIEGIASFIAGKKCLVAGSTWPDDEKCIAHFLSYNTAVKIILAPHQTDTRSIQQTQQLFPGAVLYSQIASLPVAALEAAPVLIIDSIGMLSQLYAYANITYIGGGFNRSGIHNTLEAAVYGKPVVFGPVYHKFEEAKELIEVGGGFSFKSKEELKKILDQLLKDDERAVVAGYQLAAFVRKHTGATKKIMDYVEGNLLLTN